MQKKICYVLVAIFGFKVQKQPKVIIFALIHFVNMNGTTSYPY